MPRGRGIPRGDQLSACRSYEANWALEEWEKRDQWTSLRDIADRHGVAKSTIHRWVNRDVLANDRRRSQMRRDYRKRHGLSNSR